MRRGVRPSHFRSLFNVADGGLTVRDITSTDLWSVPEDSAGPEAHKFMAEHEYDVAPLAQRPPYRYVESRWLEGQTGPVERLAQSLDASLVVTSALSLSDAMRALQERPYFFVIERQQIIGVVTRADVQRPAVSMVVLQFILIVETGLGRLIEVYFGPSWREHLPPPRVKAAEERLFERKRRNTALTIEDCLTLEDRLALVEKSVAFLDDLGYASKRSFQDWTERVKRLRDTLAHAGSVIDFDPDPVSALRYVEEVRTHAERVLSLVERSETPT